MGPKETKEVIKRIHHSLPDAHMGIKKTLAKFRERFRGTLDTAVTKQVVQSCEPCQRSSDYHQKLHRSTGQVTSTKPFDIISIDTMGPLEGGSRRFIFTILDNSGFVILVPCNHHTTMDLAQMLLRHVFSVFSLPERILSDRAPEHTAQLWRDIGELLNYKILLTAPYTPQGNGQNERTHRVINTMLRTVTLTGEDWVQHLPSIQLAINSAVSEKHSYSPFEIIYGKKAKLPIEYQYTSTPKIPGAPNQGD